MKLSETAVVCLLDGFDLDDFDPKDFMLQAARPIGLVRVGPNASWDDVIEANTRLREFFRTRDRLRWAKQFEWILTDVRREYSSVTYSFDYWHKGGEAEIGKHEARRFRTPSAAMADWRDRLSAEQSRYAFRGMSMQEWVEARRRGFLKSRGLMNLGAGKFASSEAYTTFSTDWREAYSFAGPFTNYYDNPTRKMPGVIVAVPVEATVSAKEMGVGLGADRVAERIPTDQVVGLWILTPVKTGKGHFTLQHVRGRPLTNGTRIAPTVTYAVVPKSGIALD